jgi:uncharacterized protein (TIGR02452 family)
MSTEAACHDPLPSRALAKAQGEEALAIIRSGGYATRRGAVSIAELVAYAVGGTRDYPPGQSVPRPPRSEAQQASLRVSVVNDTSLACARDLAARHRLAPMVLNFASARKPGGGFLGGARAQEESLARSSALYATLTQSGMYEHHRALRDCAYTAWAIYSPDVPVFRDDRTGQLLDEPYTCAFITAPAPNAGVVLEREPGRARELERLMHERVVRILAIAAHHQHRHLVLGAWGCGVFKNDPTHVAACFASELEGAFAGCFDEVVFAVVDWSQERRFIGPFARRFASRLPAPPT